MAEIHASINRAVAKTVKVRYSLEPSQNLSGLWRWFIAYHVNDETGEEPEIWAGDKDDEGNGTRRWNFVKKWTKVGRHEVRCAHIRTTSEGKATKDILEGVSHVQQVEEQGTFLARQMAAAKQKTAPNPYDELAMTWKWLSLLSEMAKLDGALPTKELKEQHQKRVKELETYAQKLKAILDKCDENAIWPFRAVYLAEETMEEQELRVFLTQPKGKRDRVMIVDWTNIDEPRLNGMYEGKFTKWSKQATQASMITAAFENAVDTWKDDNRYWKGAIRYEFERKHGPESISYKASDFSTGDTSWTDKAAEILKKIALGAAMIGLVLTGVGSAWAGAFIVTSMVAGSSGSVLSIHARHAKGSGSFMDDAMDVLDILGNVLGVGGRAGKAILWRKGATLELSLAGKTVKAMFIGEVWADGFNGMLLGVDFIKKYDQIMSAKGITPDDRAKQLLQLFGAAASAGVLHGLNNKITTAIENAKWRELAQETSDGVPIHIDDTPTIKGDTKKGGQDVTVVTRQKRHEPAKVDATPKTKPFPPKDDNIWRRNSVNDQEIDLMTNDGFHFNSHIDDDGIVTISIHTRKADNSQSPHLGTGQENFDRMFAHYEKHGREIKGWQGMLVADNFAAAQKAMKDGTAKTVEEAILNSVTGGKFWKPWADSKGLKFVFDPPPIMTSSFINFNVTFKPK